VILCASELASNRAAQRLTSPGGTFTVRAAIHPGRRYIRIEVEDNGGPWITAPDDPPVTTAWISSALLPKEWGINGDHAARTIWARFDWSE
jgi:hypothetical protein